MAFTSSPLLKRIELRACRLDEVVQSLSELVGRFQVPHMPHVLDEVESSTRDGRDKGRVSLSRKDGSWSRTRRAWARGFHQASGEHQPD